MMHSRSYRVLKFNYTFFFNTDYTVTFQGLLVVRE